MDDLLAFLRAGVRPHHATSDTVTVQIMGVPTEQAQFQIAVAHIGHITVIRCGTLDIVGRHHDLFQADGESMALIRRGHSRQRIQSPRHRAGCPAVVIALAMAITDPTDAQAIGVILVQTDEQVVIPGETKRIRTTYASAGKAGTKDPISHLNHDALRRLLSTGRVSGRHPRQT